MRKRIEIEHFEDGSVKVEAYGFEGGTCINATKEIEGLHGKVEARDLKSSFYDVETGTTVDTSQLCG